MRVYLATEWRQRHVLPEVAAQFEAAGHVITERWWEYEEEPGFTGISNEPDAYMEDRAVADFVGVVAADVLVLLNTGKSEGKAVETGVACAQFKPVILIGDRSNIFHYLPNVHLVKDVDGALERLQ